ncbi:MAG: hypothetical protein B7C54_06220 [Acidimicrobiales bacterium mtb01]|nr:hypothetical protein [Actinomycetota bacterium]TEX46784.1 MAG: hypothetical protein B7C54_06220 [Acidimicrobiales bacterium mtb01]
MANRAKKKSRAKKRSARSSRPGASSRLPVILLLLGALGVGGLLVVSERSDRTPASTAAPASEPVGATNPLTVDTAAPSVTIGSVAPPVTISDEQIGDLTDESELPDFTPVAPPEVPAALAPLPATAASTGRIDGDLPDGFYLGFVQGAFDDDGEYIAWRIGSTDGPTYPAFVSDMIFTSVRVDARGADHPGSASLQPPRLWQLLADGGATVAIPESDDLVILDGPYLLTVVSGSVIAAEEIRPS